MNYYMILENGEARGGALEAHRDQYQTIDFSMWLPSQTSKIYLLSCSYRDSISNRLSLKFCASSAPGHRDQNLQSVLFKDDQGPVEVSWSVSLGRMPRGSLFTRCGGNKGGPWNVHFCADPGQMADGYLCRSLGRYQLLSKLLNFSSSFQ
jgi:hypothetical protein